MSEPVYIQQTSEPDNVADETAVKAWFKATNDEAWREGARWFRYTVSDDQSDLLIEGWAVRPQSEGDARWKIK